VCANITVSVSNIDVAQEVSKVRQGFKVRIEAMGDGVHFHTLHVIAKYTVTK